MSLTTVNLTEMSASFASILTQSHIHLTAVSTISVIEIPPDALTCVSRGYNSEVPMPLRPTALTNRTERHTTTTCSRQQARLVP